MPTGIVIRKYTGIYTVETDDGAQRDCTASSKLRKTLVIPTADRSSLGRQRVQAVRDIEQVDPVAVGDRVVFNDGGMITEVLARTSKFSRFAAGTKPREQVIAANLDQVVIVVAAADPDPRWNMVDRYLVSTEASELAPLLVITKSDLAHLPSLERDLAVYHTLGCAILVTSTTRGEGIDALRAALAGRISALVGKSGVGKSSLLNAVQPGLGALVGAVSDGVVGKGKHTTTHVAMFPLDGGGRIIDTPGVREFGLWRVDERDLASFFHDFDDHADTCRFGGRCTHAHEPGCAVRAAAERGDILMRRYQSYLRLLANTDDD